MSSDRSDWDERYAARAAEEVSWYEPTPRRSLELIQAAGLNRQSGVLDVGGGASGLAARLLELGYTDLTVTDISPAGLRRAKAQLGSGAERVIWVQADVRNHDFRRTYDLWHDRAVFHFMVSPADRDSYLRTLRQALPAGGQLVIATFGPQGPTRCSGLPVQRYDIDALHLVLGEDFDLLSSSLWDHQTPSGKSQQFLYGHFRRMADA